MDHNYDKARSWMEKVAKEMQLLTPATTAITSAITTTAAAGGVSGVDVNAMYTAAEVDAMFGSDSTDVGEEVRIMTTSVATTATTTAAPTEAAAEVAQT